MIPYQQLIKNTYGFLSGHIFASLGGSSGLKTFEGSCKSEKPLKNPYGLQICARSTTPWGF
jgi:hypothetical protein